MSSFDSIDWESVMGVPSEILDDSTELNLTSKLFKVGDDVARNKLNHSILYRPKKRSRNS